MKRRGLLTRAPIVICAPAIIRSAFAQGGMGPGPGTPHTTAAGYTGPGDIVSGAVAWYGLRAYSSAQTGGTTKSVNVRRASDNTTQDIVILASGALDIASAQTFAGVDATGTGSIVPRGGNDQGVMSFTGGSVGDVVSGTGVVSGTTILASAGTNLWYVTNSQTVPSTTLTLRFALFVTKFYDQSGHSADLTQATSANQPQLLTAGGPISTLPGIASLQFGTPTWLFNNAAISAITPPYGLSIIGQLQLSGQAWFLAMHNTGEGILAFDRSGFNTVDMYGGTALTAPQADGSFHSVNTVVNGGSSSLNVDGATTTGNAGSSVTDVSVSLLGDKAAGAFSPLGTILEAGIWPSNVTSSIGALSANQHALGGGW